MGLLKLKAERLVIEEHLERARTERSSAGALLAIAHDLLDAAKTGDDVDVMTRAVLASFDALDIDRQRDIVRALLHVVVEKGREPSRVKVTHLLAVHLNLDAVDPQHFND